MKVLPVIARIPWYLESIEIMKVIRSTAEAVLRAAESWVAAQEALVAVQQISKKTEGQREAADVAGTQLALAVARWRSVRDET
jgi:hypothetical protein